MARLDWDSGQHCTIWIVNLKVAGRMQGDFRLALMVYCVFTHSHLSDFDAYHWTFRDSESGHPLCAPAVRTAYSVCTIWRTHIPLILWLLKAVMGQTLLDPRFELCLATVCFCQPPSMRILSIFRTINVSRPL